MTAHALPFLLATAAQMILLWLALQDRGAMAQGARRIQTVRQRHASGGRLSQLGAGRCACVARSPSRGRPRQRRRPPITSRRTQLERAALFRGE